MKRSLNILFQNTTNFSFHYLETQRKRMSITFYFNHTIYLRKHR